MWTSTLRRSYHIIFNFKKEISLIIQINSLFAKRVYLVLYNYSHLHVPPQAWVPILLELHTHGLHGPYVAHQVQLDPADMALTVNEVAIGVPVCPFLVYQVYTQVG